MRVHYILHADFEKLGVIDEWLVKNHCQVTGTHSYQQDVLSDASQFDLLIVMGGPQSAVHIEDYPYLQKEVDLIQSAIQSNKAVLGICLGAQLIGIALGAKAEHSPHKEIGVFPVEQTSDAAQDPLFMHFPQQFAAMHWHGDMAGLPQGAVLLAKSAGCPHQAFRYGDRVYAFQYHMELTPNLVQKMVEHCREDLTPDTYVQSPESLAQLNLTNTNNDMFRTLDYLAGLIAE